MVIGASLSEPHTSVTALRTCVCIWPATDHLPEILNQHIQIFHDDWMDVHVDMYFS